ncbi:MAG: hypothetical protein ACKO8I_12310, partial [Cyanobacteriota bacterium]
MQLGLGGGYVGQYLMNRRLWKELRREYEAKGEKLVPYSCRHGYAHRAHVICDLPPKVVAAAMGHCVQDHLAAFSCWCGDDVVEDAFAKAEQRLGQGLRAQSSAASCRTACEKLLNPCFSRVTRTSSTVLGRFFWLARCFPGGGLRRLQQTAADQAGAGKASAAAIAALSLC